MKTTFFIGTYGKEENQGIVKLVYDFDAYRAETVKIADDAPQASYLCRRGDFVYALSEQKEGGLHAYKLNGDDLEVLNRDMTLERVLAHLSADPAGKFLYRISYGTGWIGVHELQEDGSLGKSAGKLLNEGCGPFKSRQQQAHGHSITPTPDGGYVIACDLGTDEVMCIRVTEDGGLEKIEEMGVRLCGGTGPRQQAWHPDGSCVYVLTEMGYQLATLGWNKETGLSVWDLRDIRPDMPKLDREGAAVKVSPDGKFVYTSCRYDGMLDIFRIDENKFPTLVATVPSGVQQPRDFHITNDGKHLLAAGQRSGDICVFSRDPETGSITPMDLIPGIEKPVCILEV